MKGVCREWRGSVLGRMGKLGLSWVPAGRQSSAPAGSHPLVGDSFVKLSPGESDLFSPARGLWEGVGSIRSCQGHPYFDGGAVRGAVVLRQAGSLGRVQTQADGIAPHRGKAQGERCGVQPPKRGEGGGFSIHLHPPFSCCFELQPGGTAELLPAAAPQRHRVRRADAVEKESKPPRWLEQGCVEEDLGVFAEWCVSS